MSVPRDKLLDKANNSIYKLVILAAKRAKEIQVGQPALLETSKSDNSATIALKEIAAGLVHCKNREEYQKHQASQKTKKDVPTFSERLKMLTPVIGTEIVDGNEEGEISAGHQEIHPPPEDDYQKDGQG